MSVPEFWAAAVELARRRDRELTPAECEHWNDALTVVFTAYLRMLDREDADEDERRGSRAFVEAMLRGPDDVAGEVERWLAGLDERLD